MVQSLGKQTQTKQIKVFQAEPEHRILLHFDMLFGLAIYVFLDLPMKQVHALEALSI